MYKVAVEGLQAGFLKHKPQVRADPTQSINSL